MVVVVRLLISLWLWLMCPWQPVHLVSICRRLVASLVICVLVSRVFIGLLDGGAGVVRLVVFLCIRLARGLTICPLAIWTFLLVFGLCLNLSILVCFC